MTDLEHNKKRANEIAAGNLRSHQELQEKMASLGARGFEMDTGDARLGLFIQQLIEWGVITEEQLWEFEVVFHTKVEESLNDVWAQVREKEAEMKKPRLATPGPAPTLVDAQGRPLTS